MKRASILHCSYKISTFLQLRCHSDELLCQETTECLPRYWITRKNFKEANSFCHKKMVCNLIKVVQILSNKETEIKDVEGNS